MSFVRTALGDIDPGLLGPTDYHEHLFQVTPLLPGDELDDEEASGQEAVSLAASGVIGAIVEATPIGLGRNPAGAARISRRANLNVVLTTGAHRSAHYAEDHWLRGLGDVELAELFTDELTGPAVRAGILKAGIGYWSMDVFERRVLSGVAQAHVATGAPVMVHLEHGSAAHEVLDVLEDAGVSPDRVVLAHADRNPDPFLHLELVSRGCFLGYDGMARHRDWPDSSLVSLIAEVTAGGGGERILVGGDVARRTRYAAYGGMPGLAYLPNRFLPRLRAELGPETVQTILVSNAANLLAWSDS